MRGDSLESGDTASKSLVQQNIDLRHKLEEEHNSYKRKLQAYQDGQQRQAQLVQKLQAKVIICLGGGGGVRIFSSSRLNINRLMAH